MVAHPGRFMRDALVRTSRRAVIDIFHRGIAAQLAAFPSWVAVTYDSSSAEVLRAAHVVVRRARTAVARSVRQRLQGRESSSGSTAHPFFRFGEFRNLFRVISTIYASQPPPAPPPRATLGAEIDPCLVNYWPVVRGADFRGGRFRVMGVFKGAGDRAAPDGSFSTEYPT
jgi:hypothetical protein